MLRLLRIKFYVILTITELPSDQPVILSKFPTRIYICQMLISFFQIPACMCPYSTESHWWRRLPPPIQKAVGSLPLPLPLHPLLPPLPHAPRTSFTAGQKSSFFPSRTLSLTGRVLRCFLMYWRRGCICGWRMMGYTLSASARDEYTGRDLWLHLWINPTSWRKSSHANCLTPSNSLWVSTSLFCEARMQIWNTIKSGL